jgi:hypothetical protein
MLFQYFVFTASLYFLDTVLRKITKNPKSTWFFLHSYGNAIITTYCIYHIFPIIKNPIQIIETNEEIYDTTLFILILHIYHLIFFNSNKEDLFHHISFVFFGTFFKLLINTGTIICFYHFFICGLPGCIDYFILGLNKLNMISREKRLTLANEINIWVRSPGLIASHTLLVLYFFNNYNGSMPYIFSLGSYFFTTFNGIYYMRQVFSANERKKNGSVRSLK